MGRLGQRSRKRYYSVNNEVYDLSVEEANAAYDAWVEFCSNPEFPEETKVENLRGYHTDTEELYFEAVDEEGEKYRDDTLGGAREWFLEGPGKIYLVTRTLVETVEG